MADKKISGLPVATSVGKTDVVPIVQGNETKQISIESLFENIPGNIGYTGIMSTLSTPELVSSGSLSITTPISLLVNNTAEDVYVSMPNGTTNCEKTILVWQATTNKIILPLDGINFSSITFNGTGSSVKMVHVNDKWFLLGFNNITVA